MMDRRHFLSAVAALAATSSPARAQGGPAARPFSASPEAIGRLGQRLARLDEDGLDPRTLQDAISGADAGSILRTAGLALADLVQGRAAIPASRADLRRDPAAHPLEPWLQQLAQAAEPALVIDRAALRHPEAPALRAALAVARARAAQGWTAVPTAGGTLEPGAFDAMRVPPLRARLAATDPVLATAPGQGDLYDEALQAAVRRFQASAGLEADGRIGPGTLGALNRSPQALVNQLRVALDMRRGMAPASSERRIEVNVPDYRLVVLEGARSLLDMAVVVGRPSRATPMMVTRLTAVQFNPPWGVPQRLAREDLLPRLRRDAAAVQARGFRIYTVVEGERVEVDPMSIDWRAVNPDRFPYVIRQDSGDGNALGRLKFIMPNGEDIYLHDTPDRAYFRRSDRAQSSGCIRLERPMDFLALVTEGTLERSTADRLLASRATSVTALRRSLPVRLHYATVTVEGTEARVRQDIYGLDEAYARQMDSRGNRMSLVARS
jgi:murein L,D-transpeptidase YcbB/YkuD